MARVGVDWTAHAAVAGALPAHCHAAAPRCPVSPGRFCPTRALASTRSLCMAAPDGSSRPTWPPFNGRRRNADAGTASPRLRLALPRPRSQTGGSGRWGSVTGVRCPTATATSGSVQPVVVDEISSMARVGVDWTAHAAVAGALPAHCHAAAHRLSGLPGAVLSDQGVGQHEKLVHGGARRVEPTDLAPVQRPTTER